MDSLISELQELDALFNCHAEQFGRDQTPYRNHVYRLINVVRLLRPLSNDDLRKVQIAGFFHGAGTWLAGTGNSLAPSSRLACHYLRENQLQDWSRQIHLMIVDHNKITASQPTSGSLVEAFRRAAWVDLSRGLVRFDVPQRNLRDIRRRFPAAGFHRMLARHTLFHLLSEPWHPLPTLRL